MINPRIQVCKDSEALAREASKRFITLAQERISSHGDFSVVLAGGSTPRRLHELLATETTLDWSKVFIFFGDERFVPPYEPESNYSMADESLLAHVAIPEENIFPFVTMGVTLQEAADLYQQELKRFFASELPTFDLVILGMGPDGHTASLFPDHPAGDDRSGALVLALDNSPKPPANRLTLSFKALNSAQNIMLLAAGASKSEALKRAQQGEDVPISKLEPQRELLWLVDSDAASQLDLGK